MLSQEHLAHAACADLGEDPVALHLVHGIDPRAVFPPRIEAADARRARNRPAPTASMPDSVEGTRARPLAPPRKRGELADDDVLAITTAQDSRRWPWGESQPGRRNGANGHGAAVSSASDVAAARPRSTPTPSQTARGTSPCGWTDPVEG